MQYVPDQASDRPIVSVIIANHNGAAFLLGAILSAQQQTLREIEIIVSDDGSDDDSVGIVRRLMNEDQRIRLVQSESNRGPGAARNAALAVARGEWIAVLDSDDLMHPERLKKLLDAARRDRAELVADNLLEFHEDNSLAPRPMLNGRWAAGPQWVTIAEFVELNRFYTDGPNLGYLKPLFRAPMLAGAYRYDETLIIGEDYDLVARLLNAGKKLRVYPDTWYFYRKHSASLSRRPNRNALKALEALKAAHLRFLNHVSPNDTRLVAALQARQQSLDTALLFQKLVDSLKAGRWFQSLQIAIGNPRVAALLRFPIRARLRRLIP
jgi:glycosyltransferase involved in cell wall biosynthesis